MSNTFCEEKGFYVWIFVNNFRNKPNKFHIKVLRHDTIYDLKEKISDKIGFSQCNQCLIYNNIELKNSYLKSITQYNIKKNCIIYCIPKMNTGPYINNDGLMVNKQNNNDITYDPISIIKITKHEFHEIFNDFVYFDNILKKSFTIPTEIIDILYSYSMVIGCTKYYDIKRNKYINTIKNEIFKSKLQKQYNNKLFHESIFNGNILKCEYYLKELNYYIDSYVSGYDYNMATGLVISVLQGNVELTDFLLINGSRKLIKYCIKLLKNSDSNITNINQMNDDIKYQILSLLYMYVDNHSLQ